MNRRSFLASIAVACVLSSMAGYLFGADNSPLPSGQSVASTSSSAPASTVGTRFRIGVESTLPGPGWWASIYGRYLGEAFDEDIWARSLAELGAEFTLFYDSLSSSRPQVCQQITDMCRRHNMDFLFNNTYGDMYGPWLSGTGRAEYSDTQLEYASKAKQFRGIILDEVEHRQIHQIKEERDPYMAAVKGIGIQECYDRVLATATAMTERYRQHGGATVGEYVFPVMSHLFARAGIIPAPKFLSLSYPSVYFAITAGAAKQYGTELWVVHDFWGADPFWGGIGISAPGFSPETFRSNLLLAYWLGADAAYTEALHNLIVLSRITNAEQRTMQEHKMSHRPFGFAEWVADRKYILNGYGKIHRWFAKTYVPTHPRDYTFRDIRPRVAMIRFPDTLWADPDGPRLPGFRGLFGPGGPKAEKRHKAWLDAWHLLTHGAVTRDGLSIYATPKASQYARDRMDRVAEADEKTGRKIDYKYSDHYVFCPVDGVLVFDHLVGQEQLRDAELLILTGETVSEPTSRAVLRCVEAGAECLTLEHLAPATIRRQGSTCPYEVSAGKGRFVVVEDFKNAAAEQSIRRYLGPTDRIRYRFGDRVVSIRQAEGYSMNLINEADFPQAR